MTKATTPKDNNERKIARKASRRILPTKRHRDRQTAGNGRRIISVEDKILAALKEYLEFGATSPDRTMISLRCGYKNARSATFANALKSLVASNLIAYPDKDTMSLTDLGMQKAGPITQPRNNEVFQECIRGMLKEEKSSEIFDHLLDGSTVEKTELASQVGYTNAKSASFVKAIKEMEQLNLLDSPTVAARPKLKFYCLSDNAFPCGRPNTDD